MTPANPATPADCAGCMLIETRTVQHQGRTYCATCPELPEARRRQPPKADPVREGLVALLKKTQQ